MDRWEVIGRPGRTNWLRQYFIGRQGLSRANVVCPGTVSNVGAV